MLEDYIEELLFLQAYWPTLLIDYFFGVKLTGKLFLDTFMFVHHKNMTDSHFCCFPHIFIELLYKNTLFWQYDLHYNFYKHVCYNYRSPINGPQLMIPQLTASSDTNYWKLATTAYPFICYYTFLNKLYIQTLLRLKVKFVSYCYLYLSLKRTIILM